MPTRVLIVTEDPFFVETTRNELGADFQVTACLGPAQRACLMERDGTCALAQHSRFVLVDSPVTGVFYDHYHGIPTISYASRLADAHPGANVVMCDPVAHGEVPSAFMPRADAVALIRRAGVRHPKGESDEGS